MEILWDKLNDFFSLTIGYFFDSGKRIHIFYLFTSLILAYYVFYKNRQKGSFLKYIFKKKVWLSKSAFVDYKMFLFNGLVKLFLITPYVYFGFLLSFHIDNWLTEHYGYMNEPLSFSTTIIIYTVFLTLVTDLFTYLTHWSMHKIPFLWEFHKIHHSATSMNPITQYRIHPIELIINNIQGILAFGIVTGVFQYLSMGNVSKWVFLGANVFSFVFFVFGANLRHSHIKLRYFNFLEYLLISPLQHQIHHSKDRHHWNKNMGSRLAIWDWLFGTLYLSKNTNRLSFGLSDKEDVKYTSFSQNMFNPFINNFKRVKKLFRK